jgi:hypothetical protein
MMGSVGSGAECETITESVIYLLDNHRMRQRTLVQKKSYIPVTSGYSAYLDFEMLATKRESARKLVAGGFGTSLLFTANVSGSSSHFEWNRIIEFRSMSRFLVTAEACRRPDSNTRVRPSVHVKSTPLYVYFQTEVGASASSSPVAEHSRQHLPQRI